MYKLLSYKTLTIYRPTYTNLFDIRGRSPFFWESGFSCRCISFFYFMIRLYCVDRLSLWICVLLLLSGILYFSCILLYYLDCYFCIIFPHINTLYYTGHFVYVDCFVLYCIFIYIREMVLCSEWWFMLHWCCVGYQHSIWIYWPL